MGISQGYIEGHYDENKPLSYQTEEFYKISQKMVTDILVDKFGAEKIRIGHEGYRGLRFNQHTLNRLTSNYAKTEQIRIIKDADGSDTSDGCTGNKEDIKEKKIDRIEHEIGQKELLKQPKNRGISVSNPSILHAIK